MRRSLLAAVLVGIALGAGPGAPAWAHDDTIEFALTTDKAGRVVATATWADDQHRVEKPVVAMVVATSPSGQRVGPLRLTPVAGSAGVLRLEQPLPAGSWTVVAESMVPALGRGEARLSVVERVQGPAIQPAEAAADISGVVARRAQPAPAWAAWLVEVAVLATFLAGVSTAGLYVWRRRRT